MTKRKAEQATGEAATPKKKARRMKVLSTKITGKERQDIYNANAINSPLLRLPPEIRNRIWQYTLCGNTIHVTGYTSKKRRFIEHAICQVPAVDADVTADIKEDYERAGEPQWFESYEHSHTKCRGYHNKHRLTLSILKVCRQVHQEAALLPYQRNTFVFTNFWHIKPFLQELIPAQANAIEAIKIYADYGYKTKTFGEILRRKLKGLKSIDCFIALSYSMASIRLPTVIDSLMQFKRSPIARATAVVYNACYDPYSAFARPQPYASKEDCCRWAKELEDGLLASHE